MNVSSSYFIPLRSCANAEMSCCLVYSQLAVYLASAQDETLLAQLLEAKFSAAHVDQNGETALHKVVKANRAGAVSTLLSAASCLPNAADGHLQTALHRAGELGHAKCMAILLKSERVNIDAEDAWRRTALHWTAQKYDCPFPISLFSFLTLILLLGACYLRPRSSLLAVQNPFLQKTTKVPCTGQYEAVTQTKLTSCYRPSQNSTCMR